MSSTAHRPPSIALGILDISFYAVVGEIVADRLRAIGQRVTIVRGGHGALFPLLGSGDIDILVLAWLPDGHRPLWDDLAHGCRPVATVYKGARFYWAATPHAPAVEQVGDLRLTRPEEVDRQILTVGPTSSITTRSRHILDGYDLRRAGFAVHPTDPDTQHRALTDALAERRGAVFAVWTPYFLTALHDHELRELGEPKAILGGANDATIVLSGPFAQHVGAPVVGCLRSVRLLREDVAAMDADVHGGRSPQQVASAWLRARRSS